MFGRATITLGIGPHSSYYYFTLVKDEGKKKLSYKKQTSETPKLQSDAQLKAIK